VKLYLEPIDVIKVGGRPQTMLWRCKTYRVLRVEERWLWHGQWWTTPDLCGEHRRYFRLAVVSASGTQFIVEVYESNQGWVLSQLDD
jgi:hypothetical protein